MPVRLIAHSIVHFLSRPIVAFLVVLALGLSITTMALILWGEGAMADQLRSILPHPAVAHPPRININREQYKEALAKWQAQKVEEYEIATDTRAFIVGGTQILHVSDHGR